MALKLIKRALLTRAFTEAIINFLSQILVVALPFEKSKAAVKTKSLKKVKSDISYQKPMIFILLFQKTLVFIDFPDANSGKKYNNFVEEGVQ